MYSRLSIIIFVLITINIYRAFCSNSTNNNQTDVSTLNTTQIDNFAPSVDNNNNINVNESIIKKSSDYVPANITYTGPNLSGKNFTKSNANVYEAITNMQPKDPLQVNAQQQNPFMTTGGINPQIAMLLRNNPRLQMLARQNPIIAQQIIRNPQLLRDPMIQSIFIIIIFVTYFKIIIIFFFIY